LASKHRNSVFVQLNNKGDYRVVYGDPTQLSGKIRWQLVGHGGGSFSDQHTMADTMADTTAQALAIRLTHFNRKFSAQYGVNSAANYISLVGCCLVPFAKDLAQQLDQRGTRTDIAARSTILSVAEGIGALKAGSKITQDAKSGQSSQHKTVFRWNKQGQLVEKVSLKARLEQTFDLMKNHLLPTQQPLQSPREPEVDMTPRIVTTRPGVRPSIPGESLHGQSDANTGSLGCHFHSQAIQNMVRSGRSDAKTKKRSNFRAQFSHCGYRSGQCNGCAWRFNSEIKFTAWPNALSCGEKASKRELCCASWVI